MKLSKLMMACAMCAVTLTGTAQTKVIAHRGYWKCEGSAQNSIASLTKAAEAKVYGSEFDVQLTKDKEIVVNHDDSIQGICIFDTPFAELKDLKLSNGEKLSTLDDYLVAGKKLTGTQLILEIKPHRTEEAENEAVRIIVDKVNYVYSQGTAYEIQALKNINLKIEDGEFIGIIGHTGSGKSTLIQHLNGLTKATSGAIYYNGADIYDEGYNLKELRSKVGLVFQYPEHQLFETTIFEDVCFGPKNQGLTKEEAELRAFAALKSVGLPEEVYYHSPFDLSGGQKRRVAIAGVLAMQPEVLILDEPTAGLDPKGRDEILDQVAKLHKERGITVILVSHSMEDVAKYVDRIIVMNQGSVMFDDIPKSVFAHYKELEAVGLAAPQVTYLMHELAAAGIPVSMDATTVAEAKEEILAKLGR